jgi:hypothetical protein
MTLERAAASAQFAVEPPPQGGVEAIAAWALAMFDRLWLFQQQPRVQAVTLARLELATEVAKPVDGLFVWLAAGLAGAGKPEGLYFRLGGAWKLVTLT